MQIVQFDKDFTRRKKPLYRFHVLCCGIAFTQHFFCFRILLILVRFHHIVSSCRPSTPNNLMKTLSTAIFVRPIDNEILWILNGCNAFSYRLILSQKSEFVWASKNELKKKTHFLWNRIVWMMWNKNCSYDNEH